jgi:phosphate-starvation-inducible protein E
MRVSDRQAPGTSPTDKGDRVSGDAIDRAAPASPGQNEILSARPTFLVQMGINGVEFLIYLVAALLLVVAAAFTVVGMVNPLLDGSKSRDISDAGVFILDRILLLFIVAELLYTLRLVIFSGGRIIAEPFLFIGLIAVVRRVLISTAEFESSSREAVMDFLIEMGALAGLALVLVVSIYLLRRSAAAQTAQ